MSKIAFSLPEAAAQAATSEAELRVAIQTGKLLARVNDQRLVVLASDLEAYVRSLPTLQAVAAESKEAAAANDAAAARARGRAIATKALAPAAAVPAKARGRQIAERLLGKAKK